MVRLVRSLKSLCVPGVLMLMSLGCVEVGSEHGRSELATVSQAQGVGKQKVCHITPANYRTLEVGAPAVPAHLAHGDVLGSCDDVCFSETPPKDCDDGDPNTEEWCDETEGCVYMERNCSDEDEDGNPIDNDDDGVANCDDPDCANDAACLEETECNDQEDNDGDGATDCADEDCAGDPACQVDPWEAWWDEFEEACWELYGGGECCEEGFVKWACEECAEEGDGCDFCYSELEECSDGSGGAGFDAFDYCGVVDEDGSHPGYTACEEEYGSECGDCRSEACGMCFEWGDYVGCGGDCDACNEAVQACASGS